jgi:hypothetical protein
MSPDGTLGASRQSVYQVIKGESKALNAENALRAAKFLGVDPWWLATGLGSMKPATDPGEAFLLRAYREADEPGRQQMLRIIAAAYPRALTD